MNAKSFLRIATAAAAIGLCSIIAASNEPPNATPQDVFDGMRRSFQADKAKGVHLKYQWQLSGPNGGDWWIEVNDGKFEMGRGKIDKPDVTFITTDKNWVALSNGTLGGKWAFFTGRLKFTAVRLRRGSWTRYFPSPTAFAFGARGIPKIFWSAGDHREHSSIAAIACLTSPHEMPSMSRALGGCCGCERVSCSAT